MVIRTERHLPVEQVSPNSLHTYAACSSSIEVACTWSSRAVLPHLLSITNFWPSPNPRSTPFVYALRASCRLALSLLSPLPLMLFGPNVTRLVQSTPFLTSITVRCRVCFPRPFIAKVRREETGDAMLDGEILR